MENQLKLNVNSPCSENYNLFTPTSKGGFCDSCQKEVIDFTSMNGEEIINYFKTKTTQETCGRFKNSQLSTYAIKPERNKRLSFLKGISVALLSLFSFGIAQAQEGNPKVDTKINVPQAQQTFLVKGHVSDETYPLPGVNILLQGTAIGTQTDFDGNFEFPQRLKKGDALVFSYVGMKSQKVIINDAYSASNVSLKIDMILDDIVVVGKVAVKKVYKSKRN